MRSRRAVRSTSVSTILLAGFLLSSCAGLYVRDAGAPPEPSPTHTLTAWPYQEYWTGIIFNGEKIGFTHLVLVPPRAPGGEYELRSEARLAFHFLGFGKRVMLKARDWVAEDLKLKRFAYIYDLDGHVMRISGKVDGSRLHVELESGGTITKEVTELARALYPTSAIPLYPALHGLHVGEQYDYDVYDAQRQEVLGVAQAIDAYQESELFDGKAFQVSTSMAGQSTTTWINDSGEPVLEVAWGGILISTLESELIAKSYLVEATVNKRDVLIDYSLVPVNVTLQRPREIATMRLVMRGLPDSFNLPSDELQQCARPGPAVECLIQRDVPDSAGKTPPVPGRDLEPYLRSTITVRSDEARIGRTAQEVAAGSTNDVERVARLVGWIQANVEQEPVDVFSSVEVYEGRRAECQGLTWLYASFARSVGIPTRVANGLVYSGEFDGFLYHTWAESYLDDRWLPVDPTFGQVGVDATHIKLLYGERSADLMPLVDIIGKIEVDVLSSRGARSSPISGEDRAIE